MKFIAISALAAGLLLTSGCAAYRRAWQWGEYPGALVRNHCSEYAVAAVKDLRSKGIESYYVSYQIKTYDQFGPRLSSHAVCLFKDNEDWRLVDNFQLAPIKVSGKSLLSMVQWRSPQATAIITNYFELPPNIPVGKGVGNTEGWIMRQFPFPRISTNLIH